MCGLYQRPNLAATVVLRDGRRMEYCCPHCAIMGMSLADYSSDDIAEVLLADYEDASRLPAEAATIVFEPDTVPCCAPGIIAFRDSSAALAFQARYHGRILPWREVVASMLQDRCLACGMVLYPPSAIPISQTGAKRSACCPICALCLCLDTPSTIVFRCARSGKAVQVTTNGDSIAAIPATTRFWVGMIGQGADRKPAGCHFNLVFSSPESLAAWRAEHLDRDGEDLALAAALVFARKARPMMEAKRRERLAAAETGSR